MPGKVALAAAVMAMAVAAGAQASLAAPADRISVQVQAFTSSSAPVDQLVALDRMKGVARLVAPAAMQAALAKLAATPKLSPLLSAEVAALQAATDLREGNAEGAAAIWHRLGEVENWQAVGPFDNAGASAIANEEGPEKGPAVDLKARYQGKQRQVGWRPLPYTVSSGDMNLAAYLTPSQSTSAYLVSWVRSTGGQDVALRFRDDGSTRIWVDGKLVFHEQGSHSSDGFDQHAAGAHLAAGWNEILAKVGDSESADWVFSLRVTTPAGDPLPLEARDTPPPGAPTAAAAGGGVVSVTDLTADARAAATANHPAALLAYAWVLKGKQNYNAGDHLAASTFQAAIAAAPKNEDAVLDFVENDSDQSRRYQNLEQLLAADPNNARAHQDLGIVQLDRDEYWPARQNFWQALGQPGEAHAGAMAPAAAIRQAPLSALGMLECYAGFGVPPEAEAWAQALRDAGETSPMIAVSVGAILARLGDLPAALRWSVDAHAGDEGNLGESLQLAGLQQRSGQLTTALATLQQAIALNGDLPPLLETEARALAGLDRQPAALAAIRHAAALAPDQPALRVAEGEIDRQFGHNAAALDAWRVALSLNPSDSSLRDRLQLAEGGETAVAASFERPYRQDLATVVAAYKVLPAAQQESLQSGPLVVLADTHVTNIFPSGNTGRYVQQIFRVNNNNGANSLSVYPVTYDPAVEQVHFLSAHVIHDDGSSADAPQAGDQPVSESVGYETFYDVRNKFVEMPTMRAGDFVEIAYRVLPITLESLYGNYYGDIDPFGSSDPTLFQQYIVLAPQDKPLYSKAIRFTGQSTVSKADGETVYRWSERNLPAQIQEPLAPPAIEQSPYIAVSAFQTWDQFADWYRQLIRDTFDINGEMAQTVASLVKGKTTEQQKVDAIYRWVIQNTHYVALEFGIHGYRPYPVTQVFHRRYGDCKDKASLLIAMLHQAGIASEFVLVRVRELGVIDPTIPSVADFDHAIVYVPGLNLYLDGTAEYEGARELPEGDQRAFVLRIPVGVDLAADAADDPAPALTPTMLESDAQASQGKDAAEGPVHPEVTAEQPATANVISRTLNGQLDAQGNLHFSLDMILTGGEAPLYRQSLELPDRQAGVLQAMLHSQLPGISVVNATVQNDNDWDQPLEISLQGNIPNFASVDGNTLLLPRQILPRAWLPRMAALASRKTDVLIGPPQIVIEQMHVALPPGFQVAGVPPSSDVQQPFGEFQAAAGVNGNTLSIESRIETKRSLITPAQYAAFRTFWSQVDAALGRPIALQGGGN